MLPRTSLITPMLLASVGALFAFGKESVAQTAQSTAIVRHVLPSEPEMERQAAKYVGSYFLQGPGTSKRIAFTFDDGPGAHTMEILQILKKYDIKATFFLVGKNLEAHPEIARATLDQGHVIGNHTYSHPHSKTLDAETFWNDETGRTQAIFKARLGFEPALFRPPYGELTDEEIDMVKAHGMKVIGWSVDPKDWSMPDEKDTHAAIIDVVATSIHGEAIVLMHDGMGGAGLNTVRAIDVLIPELKAAGYQFTTVDRLLGVPATLRE